MQFLHHHEKVIALSDILLVGQLALWKIQQCMHDRLLESCAQYGNYYLNKHMKKGINGLLGCLFNRYLSDLVPLIICNTALACK